MGFGFFEKKVTKPIDGRNLLARQASDHVSVTSVKRRPSAVVIIFGFMGAEAGQLESYAGLWKARNCSTIVAAAPFLSLASHDATTIGEVAVTAVREAARLVRLAELSEMGLGRCSLFVHVLSYSGCQLLEEMERRIREVVPDKALASLHSHTHTATSFRCPMEPFPKSSSTRSLAVSSVSTDNECDEDEENDDDDDVDDKFRRLTNFTAFVSRPSARNCQRYLGLHQNKVVPSHVTPPRIHRKPRNQCSPLVNRIDLERTNRKPSTQTPSYNPDERAYMRDMELFASRLALGNVVFDSAPCFPSIQCELSAADACLKENHLMKLAAQSTITSTQAMNSASYYTSAGPYLSTIGKKVVSGRPEQFWRNLEDFSLCRRNSFIYGHCDDVCSAAKLKEFIEIRRKRGMKIIEYELLGSGHLQHLRRRHDRYSAFIDEILDCEPVRRVQQHETQEDWWSDDGL